MARVMTLLSSHDSANGPFLTYKGGEGKGGVQDSAIMFFGSAKKHNGQAENDLFNVCCYLSISIVL